MSTAILYYSHTGHVRGYAEKLAAETGADLFEVQEVKARNGFTAYIPGVFQAMGMKRSAIVPPAADLATYDEIVIAGPIWAGHLAPAINSVIDLLPEGKSVTLVSLSGGGKYDLGKTAALVTTKGCTVKETKSLKASEA